MALNLQQSTGQEFGPAGANHAPGLVPDPGATLHSPAWLLGDDGAFHTPVNISVIEGGTSGQVLTSTGASTPATFQTLPVTTLTPPTVQRFTSGTSQTYTPSTGIAWIRVRMVGGGGGGGASTTNNGISGSTTTFGTWTAIGGSAGLNTQISVAGPGPAGGSGGANGTGTLIARFSGQYGGMPILTGSTAVQGGAGGQSAFGGSANLMGGGSANGTAATANSGSGGAGGTTIASNGGSGGAAGEYVEFYMTAAQIGAGLTYTVAGGGAGGVAGGNAGGAGAAGIIVVEEFYQ